MTLSAGSRLGAYEILAPLGAGGMGEVYRARDAKLSREVAIKVLPSAFSADSHRLERFEKEARTASALNHPNIVTIYEIGRAGETSYIAMELVAGKTLRELLITGAMPLKRLLAVAAQAADGLAKAHAAGIVHRDLKPENLMVTKDGFVKILDFGLAKLVRGGFEDSGGTNLPTLTRGTEEGTVLGTVGYMSPEQASGEPVDFRSDQFSLGAILYELASGKRAFERPTPVQTLSAVIQDEPEPLASAAPKTPTSLVWIVERCMAKEPEERYGSTKDLAHDLAAMRDHSSEMATASTGAQPASRRSRSSRAFWGSALAALAAGVLSFLVGQRLQARRDRDAPPAVRRTLTFRRGFLTGARFAPDGQTIVYSAAWDGKPSEIFTTRVGSDDSRSLGIFPAGILAISSTGEMAISLGCENRWDPCFGTLARVSLAGGAPREVLEDVGSADWSPDGKELAVIHVVNGRYQLEYPIGKVLCRTETYFAALRVSPDGSRVAFLDHVRADESQGTLCVVDRAGHKTTLTGEFPRIHMTLWSPTSDEIFFEAQRERMNPEILAVNLSGRIRAVSRIPALEDVSRDGLFLGTGRYNSIRRDILALVPGASKERSLAWLAESSAADLSRDGRDLLLEEFSASSGRGGFVTYVRRTDGSDAKRLGEGKALALSPDGKWALVATSPGEPRLVLLSTGVGEPRALPGGDIRQYHWAAFFPSGRRILFAAEDKKGAVRSYLQDLDGSPPRPFAGEGMRATIVSPDGLEIAGSTLEGLQLIYRADGEGRPRTIEGAEPEDFLVQWSADGKSIFVRGAEERPLTVYRVDLSTGKRERWKELAPPDMTGVFEYGAGPRGVRITPDGQFYAYTFYRDSGTLTVADVGRDWWK